MTTYSINIDYTTGHSQHSERVFQEVGMNWDNIKKAKKSLVMISEHYAAFKEYDDLRYEERAAFKDTLRGKPWFVGALDDSMGWEGDWLNQVVIEKDDGSRYPIDVFWIGHFETLHMAEVCIAEESENQNDDRRIYF